MENKKIKNANSRIYDGISFKSAMEVTIYKALKEQGINPDYEANTFILSDKVRPTVPFYNRTGSGGFHLISEPISKVTYTPDFTFTLNGIFVIIEVKGFENDVFPLKRNLFRKLLETMSYPVMYFEVRTKKELLQSLEIIKMENTLIQIMRKTISKLPEKDIALGVKYLESRDFDSLQDLVDSAIVKVRKDRKKENPKYLNIELSELERLSIVVSNYNDNI